MTDLFWPPTPLEDSEPQQPETSRPPVTAPRRNAWRTTAAAAGLSALVFGGIGVGVGAALDDGSSSTAVLPSTSLPSGSLSVVPTSYAGVAARGLPSGVSITVATGNGGGTRPRVLPRLGRPNPPHNHVLSSPVPG